MSSAATLTVYGAPAAVAVCALVWAQTRYRRQPPRSPAEAKARAWWATAWPFTQFGVRVRDDGFVYRNTGRIIGLAAGAKATVAPSVPVTKVKPATGWAVIEFADGARHRQLISLRNMPAAQAEAARFNTLAQAGSAAGFARTKPAAMP